MGLSVRLRPVRPRASTRTGALGFDAFLSYSHAVDRRLAPELQRALHRLAKPWYRMRALRVLRDDASLSANPDLWQSIQAALDASRYFYPARLARVGPPWVQREVQYWLAHKPLSNLLIVLTDGVIAWNVTGGDFDWGQTTALPSSLRGVFDREPRWVDFAWVRTQEHLSPRDPRFRDGVADVAAPLHGRAKDELFGEDVRQHRRTIRLTRAAIASLVALALAASGTAVVAVEARDLARTRQRAAELNQRIATARGLVAQADNIRESDPHTALQLGVAAQRIHADDETQSSLVNTLTATRYAATLTGHLLRVTAVAFAPDGRTLATASDDHTIILWDLSDPARPRRLGQPLSAQEQEILSVAFAPDGRTLAAAAEAHTLLWDVSDRAHPRRLGPPLPGVVLSVAFAPDGHTLATAGLNQTIILWDLSDRAHPHRLGQPLTGLGNGELSVAFARDGRIMATSTTGQTVVLWDLSGRASVRHLGQPLTGHDGIAWSGAFTPDGRMLATVGSDHTAILWDLSDPSHPRRLGQPLTGRHPIESAVAFAPDGRTLVTGSSDHTIVLWDLSELDELRRQPTERACSLTRGGLNRDEWARYVPGLPYQSTCPNHPTQSPLPTLPIPNRSTTTTRLETQHPTTPPPHTPQPTRSSR